MSSVQSDASRPSPPALFPDARALAFTGVGAAPRVEAVRRGLDQALTVWWQLGALPAQGLTRDGLLVLAAGYDLDDAQCSLLLRAALARRQGMLTALRHQTDPELTALLLGDALLDPRSPLPLAVFDDLRRADDDSDAWLTALIAALHAESAGADPYRRQRAAALLIYLEGGGSAGLDPTTSRYSAQWRALQPIVLLLLGVLAVVAVAAVLAFGRLPALRLDDMVTIPSGQYLVTNSARPLDVVPVALAAFALDRTEVTNAAFRQCVEAKACPWPDGGATRSSGFLDPAFAAYPIANVTWAAATAYCAYVDRRLPTAAEWEVAAGFAPATGRYYLYPWGDLFQPQLANIAELRHGASRRVGSFHPKGSSPFGVADMAGNVAEWTATPAPGKQQVVVKGGSFQSGAAGSLVRSQASLARSTAAPWLGFRCARDEE